MATQLWNLVSVFYNIDCVFMFFLPVAEWMVLIHKYVFVKECVCVYTYTWFVFDWVSNRSRTTSFSKIGPTSNFSRCKCNSRHKFTLFYWIHATLRAEQRLNPYQHQAYLINANQFSKSALAKAESDSVWLFVWKVPRKNLA